MTKRRSKYLADGIYTRLEEWTKQEGRSTSNLAAFLLEKALVDHEEKLLKQQSLSDEKQGQQ
ncbi:MULTISPECIES: ribbon-helix-helix domain-containing protein [Microcoleaceae]|uniref:ribbon-helix-helix domain-containing protein n=1 Tax=Microcoleaceae TaxID=1892252 RepID=UPI001881AF21|nr:MULTISPECIES: hypothetical protein [unclassified Tychonema]MBE9121661.1 hypothetical protein [Tychonema sp. LEGE 07199]MBE9133750.1 hypothetical protein [Tychonema sp. LEGE 07196]